MFGIDHASGCSKSKRKMFLLHPEELGLRMERKNSLVNAKSNMAEEESFEVRKQLLLTSYFEISSTEELKKYLANYLHTSALLSMDCTAIVSCRSRFVASYIDAFIVVIKLSEGIS